MDGAKRHAKIHGSGDHDTTVETTGHKTKHQTGGADEISLSGLSGQQIFVAYNGKIADITHADTNQHTLELANPAGTGAIAGETRKIVMVHVIPARIAGTGSFYVYPNEGAQFVDLGNWFYSRGITIIANDSQRLQYSLSVANDDFDLYCFGYVVEA
jgi:hypothetical protein